MENCDRFVKQMVSERETLSKTGIIIKGKETGPLGAKPSGVKLC